MFRIRLTTGTETVFESYEEFARAVATGTVTAEATIWHDKANKWLPVSVHPAYRQAIDSGVVPGSEAVQRPKAEPPPAPPPPPRSVAKSRINTDDLRHLLDIDDFTADEPDESELEPTQPAAPDHTHPTAEGELEVVSEEPTDAMEADDNQPLPSLDAVLSELEPVPDELDAGAEPPQPVRPPSVDDLPLIMPESMDMVDALEPSEPETPKPSEDVASETRPPDEGSPADLAPIAPEPIEPVAESVEEPLVTPEPFADLLDDSEVVDAPEEEIAPPADIPSIVGRLSGPEPLVPSAEPPPTPEEPVAGPGAAEPDSVDEGFAPAPTPPPEHEPAPAEAGSRFDDLDLALADSLFDAVDEEKPVTPTASAAGEDVPGATDVGAESTGGEGGDDVAGAFVADDEVVDDDFWKPDRDEGEAEDVPVTAEEEVPGPEISHEPIRSSITVRDGPVLGDAYRRRRSGVPGWIIGAVVVIALAVAGWFGRGILFGPASDEPADTPASADAPTPSDAEPPTDDAAATSAPADESGDYLAAYQEARNRLQGAMATISFRGLLARERLGDVDSLGLAQSTVGAALRALQAYRTRERELEAARPPDQPSLAESEVEANRADLFLEGMSNLVQFLIDQREEYTVLSGAVLFRDSTIQAQYNLRREVVMQQLALTDQPPASIAQLVATTDSIPVPPSTFIEPVTLPGVPPADTSAADSAPPDTTVRDSVIPDSLGRGST